MAVENKIFQGSIKAVPVAEGAPFEADHIVSVFGNKDHVGDVVKAGAFAETIGKIAASGRPMASYYAHRMDDPNMCVGTVKSLAEVHPGDPRLIGVGGKAEANGGLLARVQYDDTPTAQQVVKMIKDGRLNQSSFTYEVLDGGYVSADKAKAAGNDDLGDHYEIRKVELLELGPCQLGCNDQTTTVGVKSRHEAAKQAAQAKPTGPIAYVKTDTTSLSWDTALKAAAPSLPGPFAWHDGKVGRFLHHDDTGRAFVEACVKGIEVLNQGGAVPDADVQGVYEHLASHLSDAGVNVPELKARAVKAAYVPEPYHRDPDENVECVNCGKFNSPDAKFCDQCGHTLTGSGDATVDKTRKAGRALNAANEKHVQTAVGHLNQVLSSVGSDDGDGKTGGTDGGASGGTERSTDGKSGQSTGILTVGLCEMETELLSLQND